MRTRRNRLPDLQVILSRAAERAANPLVREWFRALASPEATSAGSEDVTRTGPGVTSENPLVRHRNEND
jgi:hypothetical protein